MLDKFCGTIVNGLPKTSLCYTLSDAQQIINIQYIFYDEIAQL